MKWRIIGYFVLRGKVYVQITNDIDTVDYVSEEELREYGLENGI